MYSAKNVFPVPLSPWRMTGVAAGAKACAREIASIIGGAKAIGSFDHGRERRSGSREGVVTQVETLRQRNNTQMINFRAWSLRSRSSVRLLSRDYPRRPTQKKQRPESSRALPFFPAVTPSDRRS